MNRASVSVPQPFPERARDPGWWARLDIDAEVDPDFGKRCSQEAKT
jgi:hypothetical protein